jgi:cytochrome c-type biogenesis protein CcmH/NrfG
VQRLRQSEQPNHKSAIRNPQSAILFLIALALALVSGTFIVKQLLASSLIAFSDEAESRALAVNYAPFNPQVLAAHGKYLLYRAEVSQPAEGLARLESAVKASPFDFRFWLELGRGYESDNQLARAERTYQQAQTLAPRYFETHWALANFYLRNTRTEEALRAFRTALELSGEKVGETDARAALNAYEAVAQGLGMNLGALRQIAPPDARAQAYLAKYLAEHQALDAALEIWRGLPASVQRERQDILPSVLAAAQTSGRFQEARELWRTSALSNGAPDWEVLNLIYNGGFEREFITSPAGFDWQPTSHTEVLLRRDDAQAHAGRYVWRMTFAAQMKSELNGPAQLLVVEPNKPYRLRFFAKTTKVPDNAPFIELTDAERPQLFAVRAPVPTGTQDWREVVLTFTTPAETRALRLAIRAPQLTEVNTGRIAEVWLDDLSLQLNGNVL